LGYSKLQHQQGYRPADYSNKHQDKSEITEDKAKEWAGWGTALKPALEPITVARKPIEKGLSIAENCLKWGTGGINIDESRVEYQGKEDFENTLKSNTGNIAGGTFKCSSKSMAKEEVITQLGRFPANLIHDGSQEVLELFPNTGNGVGQRTYDGSGSAARFFYCAKASKAERNRGCEGLEEKIQNNTETNSRTFNDRCLTCKKKFVGSDNTICHCPPELKITDKTIYTNKNNHPTIKPIALMEYLVKLVTREGQTVLDPFAGSGTTGIACKNLNRNAILIEREAEYVEIAKRRIAVNQ
jgi:site-specific DNA-methyltransferase (adenine-specific)